MASKKSASSWLEWCGIVLSGTMGLEVFFQVIGNPPNGPDVLRVGVVFVGPHKRCRALRLGVGDLSLRWCEEKARWGKVSPVQDLKTFRPRHHRGELATLSAPVCGVFRPRILPPESEVRRLTLRVGRVSHDSLIIHARVIIHFLHGRCSFSGVRVYHPLIMDQTLLPWS